MDCQDAHLHFRPRKDGKPRIGRRTKQQQTCFLTKEKKQQAQYFSATANMLCHSPEQHVIHSYRRNDRFFFFPLPVSLLPPSLFLRSLYFVIIRLYHLCYLSLKGFLRQHWPIIAFGAKFHFSSVPSAQVSPHGATQDVSHQVSWKRGTC